MIQLLRCGRVDDPVRKGAYCHAGRPSRRDAAALFAGSGRKTGGLRQGAGLTSRRICFSEHFVGGLHA